MMCYTCGKHPRRSTSDSMCRLCRNEYVRLWKAKQRHGPTLEGYEPRPYKKAVIPERRVRIRCTPPTEKETQHV